MISILAATFILVPQATKAQQVTGPVVPVCPMTGEASTDAGKSVDYNGVRYTMCCGGCDAPFKKDPAAALKSDKLKGKVVGVSLFDPVSGARIEAKDAKSSVDFAGTRYFFSSVDERKEFDADPKKFTATPKQDALFCAVMGHELKDYATAGGYADIEGTRYYTCCTDCLAQLKKNPALAAKAKNAVHAPVAMDAPVKKKG